MLLRPKILDESIRFVNPVFSVKRKGWSVFYNALMDAYKNITTIPGARARVSFRALASSAGQSIDFKGIQRCLQEVFYQQFKIYIDFTKTPNGQELTKDFIDQSMLFDADNPAKSQDYIEALMHYCAQDYFATLVEPVFYSAKHEDELSNMTQFFMAHVNIYCRANNLSSANFGVVLDNSEDLSTTIAAIVYSCILSGTNIEDALLNFVNEHSTEFGLTRPLAPA
ncbi:MAG: hypothetical protein ACHP6H_07555, partial [Legionellales bacterium]